MASGFENDSGDIRDWHSIVTLIVFVLTNIIVLFPFHVPVYLPRAFCNGIVNALSHMRVIPPHQNEVVNEGNWFRKTFKRFRFPLNFVTVPIIADLFLLAITAIGRDEVYAGTIGADHIFPIDIMVFFITLAYIAISIDASGLIRWLAFKVLGWGGEVGHRLFFYLYAFFFGLGTFIGNDPIILSGTAFLAYMTRVSKNIRHPKAWIYSQFAIANIASAILVSSNPTNLVLAGAFNVKFITYTANMIVPVAVTAIVLFPFLLYIVFADEDLIPSRIERFSLPTESANREPINPNIPNARAHVQDEESGDENAATLVSLEEILNPFLDRRGAIFGAVIMAVTLVTVLALNAASASIGEQPVFYVTLPAAFVMLCWDLTFGWLDRGKTRAIAQEGRRKAEEASRARQETELRRAAEKVAAPKDAPDSDIPLEEISNTLRPIPTVTVSGASPRIQSRVGSVQHSPESTTEGSPTLLGESSLERPRSKSLPENLHIPPAAPKATLVSKSKDFFQWMQETFPTVSAVLMHLPVALVPFAFAMFVLVQALVSKGWVKVFAYGWNHWVLKTGTVGAIGGMGFLSVILCNFAGTNIGTTILLSRVIQQWYQINEDRGTFITDRTFWATVYSMALGVNYGAFSTAFSASLAGLLWKDILARKHIKVHALDFARVNFPIIAISMAVGSAVLIGEVYAVRHPTPYKQKL